MDKRTFAICHRAFLFLDEWCFYLLLIFLLSLYLGGNWPIWPLVTTAIIGTPALCLSYKRQWEMESNLE